jgi:hypothetical protein
VQKFTLADHMSLGLRKLPRLDQQHTTTPQLRIGHLNPVHGLVWEHQNDLIFVCQVGRQLPYRLVQVHTLRMWLIVSYSANTGMDLGQVIDQLIKSLLKSQAQGAILGTKRQTEAQVLLSGQKQLYKKTQ